MNAPDRRRYGALALVAVISLLAAACGGSDDDDSAGDDGPDVDPAEVLGAEQPAEGEPLLVGWVDDGTTDVIDHAPQKAAAEASVEYVNTYLGGIAGRPIELDICSTDQTPSGAADCVTPFVDNGVAAVLNGATGQSASLFPPLAEAGIPVITPGTGDQDSLFTPGIYILANGPVALLSGPAKLAADAGIEKAAIAVIDVPAASGAVEGAASLFYDALGVEVEVVTIPPDAADFTPDLAAAIADDVGMFTLVGDSGFCAKALNGLANAGWTGETVIISQCYDQALIEQAPSMDGVYLTTFNTTDPDSEEYQLYLAVMEQFAGEDAEVGGVAPSAYQAVVGFARAMEGLTGDVTPDTIMAQLAAMEPTPMPLIDDVTFQCNGEQIALAPNTCSLDVLLATLDADGNPGEYELIEGAPLLPEG
jgi:branched-chain amino acid transport system substrate-binding protein